MITEKNEKPCFVLTVDEDPEFQFELEDLQECFIKITERVNELRKAFKLPPISLSQSFPENFFGFSIPCIIKMIEGLPNAGLCQNYHFKVRKELNNVKKVIISFFFFFFFFFCFFNKIK